VKNDERSSALALVLALTAMVLFFVSAQGVAHYCSEMAIAHKLRAEAKENAQREESAWLKWQEDQIEKYKKEHPSSQPQTPDFHDSEKL
jgi:hypothetical protein